MAFMNNFELVIEKNAKSIDVFEIEVKDAILKPRKNFNTDS